MATEATVQKIVGILGVGSAIHIRTALHVSEPVRRVRSVSDLRARLSSAAKPARCLSVYNETSDPILKIEAIHKIDSLLRPISDSATIGELIEMYDCTVPGSSIRAEIEIRLEKLLRLELVSAKTIAECITVHHCSPVGNVLRLESLQKALGLATTAKHCLEIASCDTQFMPYVVEKIEILLQPTFEAASTFVACKEAYYYLIPEECVNMRSRLLQKAIGFATSVNEFAWIFEHSTAKDSLEAHMAIRAIAKLLDAKSA